MSSVKHELGGYMKCMSSNKPEDLLLEQCPLPHFKVSNMILEKVHSIRYDTRINNRHILDHAPKKQAY